MRKKKETSIRTSQRSRLPYPYQILFSRLIGEGFRGDQY